LKIIDEIIPEPVGGAHRNKDLILDNLRNAIRKNLNFFINMDKEEILLQRKNRFLFIGRNRGFKSNSNLSDNLSMKTNILERFLNKFSNKKNYFIISIVAIILICIALLWS
jgi:acetyl-CoA carboxylase carboxyl transferase subunit alpha